MVLTMPTEKAALWTAGALVAALFIVDAISAEPPLPQHAVRNWVAGILVAVAACIGYIFGVSAGGAAQRREDRDRAIR